MKNFYKQFIVFLFSSFYVLNAQITTLTLTPAQYVQNVLLGGGVTASNITYTGLAKQIASFTATSSSNLGLTKGVYLTSGSNGLVAGEVGPTGPSSVMQSEDQNQPGDNNLDVVAGIGTNDAAVLEFDFIPQSDTVKFRYIFGSEEYNNFINSNYNDAFAFILSGVTTPLAATNIALIPNTTTQITINNVNNGNATGASAGPCTNCIYFRDNVGGSINCVYNGLTTVLTAKKKVLCGEKYHIKIAIADAYDGILDSGVFLEAGSFSSIPPISVSSNNSNASFTDSVMVEDCNTNCIYFVRNANTAVKDSFKLDITGNAILNTDYVQVGNASFNWPTKLVYSANQDTFKICNLKALNDNISEPTDTIIFTLTSYTTSAAACALSASIKFKLYIKDYKTIAIGQSDTTFCNGQSPILNANASFGLPIYTYTWQPTNSNNATLNLQPVTQPTNYTITVNDICNKPVSKVIVVTPITLPVLSAIPSSTFCIDTIKKITVNVTGGKPNYFINWQIPSNGITPYDTVNKTYYFLSSSLASNGSYTIIATDQCGKKDTIITDLTILDCTVIAPNVVTANGDGINDVFKINGLENFPNSNLTVFNRWGNKIYSSENYRNDWKPTQNDGTYFYVLNVSDGRKLNGFFELFKN